MGKIRIVDNPSKRDWAQFLDKIDVGNLQQSFEYGEVVKLINPHTKVIRLLALNDNNAPVGLVQARYNSKFGFGDRLEVGGVYGYGPVVDNIEAKQKVLSELVTSLEKFAKKEKICESFIFTLERVNVLETLDYVFERSFNVYKVSLDGDVEDLWKRIAHNKRRNIKKAQKHGVEVICSQSHDDLASFYKMHVISGKRAGFIPQPFTYFDSFLKVFRALGKAKVFLALFDGKPVAGVFVVIHGNTAYALGAGSYEEGWHVRSNDILHWKAMEWACNEGLSYYHMGFVSDPPPIEGSPGWGLWRWKREWKGLLEKVFVYHKVFMPKFKKFFLTPYEKIYDLKNKLAFKRD